MRQALKTGQKIYLSDNNDKYNKIYEYIIKEITGFGASCIVYEAYYNDSLGIKHLVRLKEFYPVHMGINRDEDLNLVIKDEYIKKFEEEGNLFIDAYKKNVMFQMDLDTLNSTGNVQNFLYGNNTMYMVVNYNNGTSYDKIKVESLHDIFQIGLALAKTIKSYHKNGYLHLDIKPENILKLPETNEMVILFDFGSIESIENIHTGKSKNISYSENWAAPEQLQYKLKKICESTDIYSIGAVLFYKIMGRLPCLDDRKVFANWEFDLKDPRFEGVNPKIFRYIKELFKKTLRSMPSKRYKNSDELIEILEKLVHLSVPNSIYLKSNFVRNDNVFIGRQREIKLIYNKLENETDAVFLHGFGGIGKSVLAKQYAFLYKDNYDTIVFANYATNLFNLVLNDRELPIANFRRSDDEKDKEYFERKLDKLYDLCDKKTLIIIDNFDVDEDDNLEKLINCGCKFIITTRNDFTDYNYHQIEIKEFDNMDDLRDLFYSYNKIDYCEEERDTIDKIIKIVDKHTMTVELIAKQLRITQIAPEILYEKLKNLDGITSENKEKVKLRKDRKLNNKSIMAHLEIVFDMAKLSKFEKYILMNMSLIANIRIDKTEFMKWCLIDEFEELNLLIDKGWIEFKEGRISLHQIIIDLVYNKLKPTCEKCDKLTQTMTQMATMRIKNNTTKRNQYINLINIFAERINGKNIELAQFYNNFADLLSSRYKDDCIDYYKKAVDIYSSLDFDKDIYSSNDIKQHLINTNFNMGAAYITLMENNTMRFVDEEEIVKDYLEGIKISFGNCIKLQEDIYGEKSLQVANEYIKIAKVIFYSLGSIYMTLDNEQAIDYFAYFEKCLLNSFEIKREILGIDNQETKDICYELYQYYMANSTDVMMFKDFIQDKKKALYYGELYMGE